MHLVVKVSARVQRIIILLRRVKTVLVIVTHVVNVVRLSLFRRAAARLRDL